MWVGFAILPHTHFSTDIGIIEIDISSTLGEQHASSLISQLEEKGTKA